jgi:hypothetical protein
MAQRHSQVFGIQLEGDPREMLDEARKFLAEGKEPLARMSYHKARTGRASASVFKPVARADHAQEGVDRPSPAGGGWHR